MLLPIHPIEPNVPPAPAAVRAGRRVHRAALPATAPRAPVVAGAWRWLRLLNVPTWPAPAVAAACVALLAGIAFGDWKSGTKIRVTPLYFLPIIMASLRFEARGALLIAAASTFLAIWPSPPARVHAGRPVVLVVNAIVEALGFTFVTLVTGALQRQSQQLRQQRRELQTAQRDLQADMQAAELLQGHLLRRPLPAIPGLDLAAEIVFARGVGGDFYDLRRVDGHLAICVADIYGKGAQAALISAALRGFLDEAAGSPAHPPAFLQHLNERLFDTLPEEMFVTMFYGCLDLESGELRYASAGHDPPLLCRGARVEELLPTGPALGLGLEMPLHSGGTVLHPRRNAAPLHRRPHHRPLRAGRARRRGTPGRVAAGTRRAAARGPGQRAAVPRRRRGAGAPR